MPLGGDRALICPLLYYRSMIRVRVVTKGLMVIKESVEEGEGSKTHT